jgi:hypothetical protein
VVRSAPAASFDDPYSSLGIAGSGSMLNLLVDTDASGGDIGVKSLDGNVLGSIGLDSLTGGNLPSFSLPQAFVEPFDATNGYFASHNYFGTYSGFTDGTLYLAEVGGGDAGSFAITSLTIAPAAIPEPSTYAAVLGVAVLGVVALRRRRSVA